jgi:hypothetical protein
MEAKGLIFAKPRDYTTKTEWQNWIDTNQIEKCQPSVKCLWQLEPWIPATAGSTGTWCDHFLDKWRKSILGNLCWIGLEPLYVLFYT